MSREPRERSSLLGRTPAVQQSAWIEKWMPSASTASALRVPTRTTLGSGPLLLPLSVNEMNAGAGRIDAGVSRAGIVDAAHDGAMTHVVAEVHVVDAGPEVSHGDAAALPDDEPGRADDGPTGTRCSRVTCRPLVAGGSLVARQALVACRPLRSGVAGRALVADSALVTDGTLIACWSLVADRAFVAVRPFSPTGPLSPGGPCGPVGPPWFHWIACSLERQLSPAGTTRSCPFCVL